MRKPSCYQKYTKINTPYPTNIPSLRKWLPLQQQYPFLFSQVPLRTLPQGPNLQKERLGSPATALTNGLTPLSSIWDASSSTTQLQSPGRRPTWFATSIPTAAWLKSSQRCRWTSSRWSWTRALRMYLAFGGLQARTSASKDSGFGSQVSPRLKTMCGILATQGLTLMVVLV